MNPTSNDHIMESYYSFIGEAHLANVLEELEANKEQIEQVEVPKSLTKWLESYVANLVHKKKQQLRKSQMSKYASRAAVLLLFVILTGTILTFSVEAIRIRVFNMMLSATDSYTEIRFDEAEEAPTVAMDTVIPNFFFEDKVMGNYYPAYIPEGYVLEQSNNYGTMTNYLFIDGAGRTLYFDQSSLNGGMQIDTEDALVTHPVIDGATAIMAEEDGQVILVWHNTDFAFTLIGEMTREEALKIAGSIKKE